jgi:hypothetical protein
MAFLVLFVKLGEDGFLSQKQKSLPKNNFGAQSFLSPISVIITELFMSTNFPFLGL